MKEEDFPLDVCTRFYLNVPRQIKHYITRIVFVKKKMEKNVSEKL